MSDLGNVCMAVVICYTFRSVFFRWAEHLERKPSQKREAGVIERLERER